MELIRKPEWLKARLPSGERYALVKKTLGMFDLHTVCEEARCPNIAECWGSGTATIMIMGDVCTRGCRFCSVKSGHPNILDVLEPQRVAIAVKEWRLRYVVITSVCRDDLHDGGAEHIASTIRAIKKESPDTIVEPLIPDFNGNLESLMMVIEADPEVISHNIETVRRLTPKIRDARASYDQSLTVLRKIKEASPKTFTKSSIMLGIGETGAEVIEAMKDLRSVGVDILTLGQYLQPTQRHIKVVEYVTPQKFNEYKEVGEAMGFLFVASGPLVRSSYRAGEFFLENVVKDGGNKLGCV